MMRPALVAMARSIAYGYLHRLPSSVPADAIIQAGLVGAWSAITRDPRASTVYLRMRIRGEICDELRRQDWLPRRARARIGADPEVPANVTVRSLEEEYEDWQDEIGHDAPSPEAVLLLRAEVERALQAPVSETDAYIIDQTFFRGKMHREVAVELGISEARVSQRESRALAVMRAHLTGGLAGPRVALHTKRELRRLAGRRR
jgi:RNA polymerase sigma factor (sigma-70 family)